MGQLFRDGAFVDAVSGGVREIRCPADGTLVATVSEAGPDDAKAAVGFARRAFDTGEWPRTSEVERGRVLLRVADLLLRDRDEVARAESLDTGKRLVESQYDVDDVVACFRYFGGIAGSDAGRVVDTGRPNAISRVVHEPVGVCVLITPWNYPLLQASWKVAPALVAGNTFVLKPSELTPSSSLLLMRLLSEAGLPDGVAGLVLGAGSAVGDALTEHPDVDLVSFTGGVATGRRVMVAAAGTVKRVALELGGKNPNIVFADADLDLAVDLALTAVFLHSGQVCSAGARLVVQREVHDQVVDEVVRRAELIRLGGPFDEDVDAGALISAAHRDAVHAHVGAAVSEGAVLRCGGAPPEDERLADGFYYRPTVLDGCSTAMSCVQEESFGPVLSVETFTDEADAIRIANDTRYGLAGAVFTRDAGRGQRVAQRLRAGTVWITDYHPYVPQAEWGGMKQSGNGRELGLAGLADYRETKHIWQNTDPSPQLWFRR